MSTPAYEVFRLRLQVGRMLRGRMLSAIVFLRELPLMFFDAFGSQSGAPTWVVVEDRATGRECWRVAAGRDYGAGELILAEMRTDAEVLTQMEFVTRWRR